MQQTGRIVEEQKNYYRIQTGDGFYTAMRSGRLKREAHRLCAGDLVDITINDAAACMAIITGHHVRTSYIPRPPLANIDQVVLITAWRDPPIEPTTLDRFLINVTLQRFTPLIVFNKCDLLQPGDLEAIDRLSAFYASAGYDCLCTSAATGQNIDALLQHCTGRFSCFAGVSGVGKSALLQRIFPDRTIRTGELARATGRGAHTTTTTTLLPLACGGWIADTPGYTFIDLPDIDEEELGSYFPEIERLHGTCRFNNCTHRDEPDCVVKSAVEEGSILTLRYASYCTFFQQLRERRLRLRRGSRRAG